MKFSIVLRECVNFSISGCKATTKPEVVMTVLRYEIEMQFPCLCISFLERQSQWNIDRHEIVYSSVRNLPTWMHSDQETGSSYNYASVWGRNAISATRYRFLRMPKSTEQNLRSVDVPSTLSCSRTYIWTPKLHFYLASTHCYNCFRFCGRSASI